MSTAEMCSLIEDELQRVPYVIDETVVVSDGEGQHPRASRVLGFVTPTMLRPEVYPFIDNEVNFARMHRAMEVYRVMVALHVDYGIVVGATAKEPNDERTLVALHVADGAAAGLWLDLHGAHMHVTRLNAPRPVTQ